MKKNLADTLGVHASSLLGSLNDRFSHRHVDARGPTSDAFVRTTNAIAMAVARYSVACETARSKEASLNEDGIAKAEKAAEGTLRFELATLEQGLEPLRERVAADRTALLMIGAAKRPKAGSNESVVAESRAAEIRAALKGLPPAAVLRQYLQAGDNEEFRAAVEFSPVQLLDPQDIEIARESRSRDAAPLAWSEIEDVEVLVQSQRALVKTIQHALGPDRDAPIDPEV